MSASAANLTLSVLFNAVGGRREVVPALGEPGLPESPFASGEPAEMVAGDPAGGLGRSRRTLLRFVRPTAPVTGEPGAEGLDEVRDGCGKGRRTEPTDEVVDCLLRSVEYAWCEIGTPFGLSDVGMGGELMFIGGNAWVWDGAAIGAATCEIGKETGACGGGEVIP